MLRRRRPLRNAKQLLHAALCECHSVEALAVEITQNAGERSAWSDLSLGPKQPSAHMLQKNEVIVPAALFRTTVHVVQERIAPVERLGRWRNQEINGDAARKMLSNRQVHQRVAQCCPSIDPQHASRPRRNSLDSETCLARKSGQQLTLENLAYRGRTVPARLASVFRFKVVQYFRLERHVEDRMPPTKKIHDWVFQCRQAIATLRWPVRGWCSALLAQHAARRGVAAQHEHAVDALRVDADAGVAAALRGRVQRIVGQRRGHLDQRVAIVRVGG